MDLRALDLRTVKFRVANHIARINLYTIFKEVGNTVNTQILMLATAISLKSQQSKQLTLFYFSSNLIFEKKFAYFSDCYNFTIFD